MTAPSTMAEGALSPPIPSKITLILHLPIHSITRLLYYFIKGYAKLYTAPHHLRLQDNQTYVALRLPGLIPRICQTL
ncbi:hypothetical protein GCWU000322_00122 [Eubacterium saphenum ATCC 49989]|nr:hypothetical protein GCWU000322_00122 [Eubacterium saphenum ATCC 49989]